MSRTYIISQLVKDSKAQSTASNYMPLPGQLPTPNPPRAAFILPQSLSLSPPPSLSLQPAALPQLLQPPPSPRAAGHLPPSRVQPPPLFLSHSPSPPPQDLEAIGLPPPRFRDGWWRSGGGGLPPPRSGGGSPGARARRMERRRERSRESRRSPVVPSPVVRRRRSSPLRFARRRKRRFAEGRAEEGAPRRRSPPRRRVAGRRTAHSPSSRLRTGAGGAHLGALLLRSSVHGKGLSRFWSCVEGYNGPVLILLSAFSNGGGENVDADRWGICVLTEEGFANKNTFYGNSGFLCSTYPIFRMLRPSGQEKNFIYCHLHPQIRVYEANPKPVGLAFGGTIGKERIFLDEDFSKVTIRHHAVDKTYQHGSLIPNQGYLPIEASILDVEVWGLGGETSKRQQNLYKKREDIFSEQRRKVDLKTFGDWEDSPEKMMMDMVSDPNRVRREDR